MKNLVAKLFIALVVLGGIPGLALANASSINESATASAGFYNTYRIPAYSTQTHRIWLNPGHVDILISGDGDTDLDLFIIDGFGNTVQRKNNYGDDESACFNVSKGGYFTVQVRNLGKVYNDYRLVVR